MHRALRRWLLASVLSLFTLAQARGDMICDRLAPFGLLPPSGGFSFGCGHVFNLKLGANLGPDGNYILLSYPSCASGPCAGDTALALLQCAAVSGYFCCISTAQMIPTITGTNVGTLVTGLNQRIANDTDTRAAICHEIYTGNESRVANVPLIQFVGQDRSQAQMTGFLTFFLVGPPSGSGTSTTIPVEILSDPTPARQATWGSLKLLYR
jgi:hypothetical protein